MVKLPDGFLAFVFVVLRILLISTPMRGAWRWLFTELASKEMNAISLLSPRRHLAYRTDDVEKPERLVHTCVLTLWNPSSRVPSWKGG